MKENKKIAKEEKIKKAKQLIQDLNNLELTDEELKLATGGNFMSNRINPHYSTSF